MSESVTAKEETLNVEEEGRSLAKYLVEEILPTIAHSQPLNCLIATITLVNKRIERYNDTKYI
jgi:hypothetical protein